MKKTMAAVLSAVLLFGFSAFAGTYQSDFGFRLELPQGWTIVSKKGVKEKPEIVKAVFETAEKNRTLLDMPEALFNKLQEKISGGDVEYYYKTDSPNFSISVYQDNGSIPASPDTAREACRSLPEDLVKVSKNPSVKVYECRLAVLGNTPALYVAADAYERGQKYVQYMVQKGPNEVLLFSATSSGNQDFDSMKAAFDDIMKTYQGS
jgi:hypothetical protein